LKVLLVYPCFLEARIHVEEIAAVPMGVYYIGAMLEAHGHCVEIVNWHRRPDSQEVLKERLISYRPGIIRACWGMAMVYQRQNRWDRAIDILNIGLANFPKSEELAIGMGVCLMRTAQYRRALEYLLPHAHSDQAAPYIERCRRELSRTNTRHCKTTFC
jgi:predicted Zn-dependent protease